MPTEITCPCGTRFHVADEMLGTRFQCPRCGAVFEPAPAGAGAGQPSQEPYEQGAIARAMSGNTVASNPGRLTVNLLKYARCYPVGPVLFVLAIAGAAVVVVVSPGKIAYLLAVAAVAAFFWFRLWMTFRHGCINPAVVVSTNPYLVAVYTDLTTGGAPWHVIKILRQPLGSMTGGPPPLGARLGTIAVYEGEGQKGHWDNFDPKVVGCVTTNQAAIERVLASIPPDEWQALEAGLKQVPTPYKPGLYPFQMG